MTALRKPLMTVEKFLVWAQKQPDDWELFDGIPVAMAPERVVHGRTKYRIARAFDDAIAAAGLQCEVVLDSAAVRIDARNSYQPDALVYCGEPVSGDAVLVRDPIIVVEVLSPGNALKDLRDKLQGYFRVASIQHYLIVDPDKRLLIHHARGAGDVVNTRIINEGGLSLDPPGLTLSTADLFGAA